MTRGRIALFWIALSMAVAVPVGAAAISPLLQWREPVYIVAGFAGVLAMVLMLFQPMLAAGYLAGVSGARGRIVHRWLGSVLVFAVVTHVVGLWITSPPDVIDALLFVSPTPFSVWGVIAMWGLFATAGLVVLRRWLRLRPRTWRVSHKSLAAIIVTGSVVHALLIDGTMEKLSKIALCALVAVVAVMAILGFRQRK